MRVQLTKWGNSLGLRMPRDVARKLDLSEGSQVELETDGAGRVILTPNPAALYLGGAAGPGRT